MSSEKLLITTPAPGVRLLTLNRPDCLNALDIDLCLALDIALNDAASEAAIGCVVIAGAGERAFSAGYDVRELADEAPEEFVEDNRRRYEWMWRIAEYAKPIIVASHGITMGAGAIIAVSADIRIGCEETVFKFTAATYGSAMLTWNLPPLVGWSKAKEYLMTSCKIDGAEALRSGLLNRIVEKNQVISSAVEMAQTIASYPGSGPQTVKRLMREGLAESQRHRFDRELLAILGQIEGQPNNVGEIFSHLISKSEK